MASNLYIGGVLVENIFGPKGTATAAATGIKIAGVDLNQSLLALSQGVAISFATNAKVGGTDLNGIFGAPATSLPINGKTYVISAVFASGASGSSSFTFGLTSTAAWASSCARAGTSSGTPAAGNIDVGSIPSGAASVRYTPTWLNASGDTSAATTVTNGAASATALGSLPSLNISLNGNGVSTHQTTYNFKVEFLNSGGAVISTSNFTVQLVTDGSA